MTVQVRLTRSSASTRRLRRLGRAEHAPARSAPASIEPATAAPRSFRRQEGPAEDRALYTCQCGFVFEAAVSTSVGCPHCGGTQAW